MCFLGGLDNMRIFSRKVFVQCVVAESCMVNIVSHSVGEECIVITMAYIRCEGGWLHFSWG